MEYLRSKDGGFLRLIVLIILLLLLMNFYDISFVDMNNALKSFFARILPD